MYVVYLPCCVLLQNHVLRVPSGTATQVRAMLFANKAMASRDHLEQQASDTLLFMYVLNCVQGWHTWCWPCVVSCWPCVVRSKI